MTNMQLATLICTLGFLTLLTGVGVWHARRVKTGEDFALAGRRLPTFVVFGTLVATWIGTGSIFGNAEKTYEHGAVMFILPVAGVLGIALLALLAGRARDTPADSVPEILALRFGRPAQILGALALISAYLIIVSYQFRAGAAIVDKIYPGFGQGVKDWIESAWPAVAEYPFWKTSPGVLAFAVFVIVYTMLAGMVSVAWTDLINGILMAVGIFIALGILLSQYLASDPATLPKVEALAEPVDSVSAIGWVGLTLPTFLLVLGDANLYQRFMSSKSAKSARRSAVFMFIGVLVMESAIIALAFLGRQLLPDEPGNHGHTVIEIAFTLVPAWLGVMLVMAAVAVIVTTADSYLLGSATSIAADLTGKLTSAGKQRVIVLLLGLVAIGLAFTSDKFFDVALYAYTLYGATLTPAVVCALVWPRVPSAAIVAGMAAGLVTALVWKGLDMLKVFNGSVLSQIDAVLPALGLHMLVLVGLTLAIGLRPANAEPDETAA